MREILIQLLLNDPQLTAVTLSNKIELSEEEKSVIERKYNFELNQLGIGLIKAEESKASEKISNIKQKIAEREQKKTDELEQARQTLCDKLFNALKYNTHVETFDISNNNLNDSIIDTINSVIRVNKTLRELNLSSNQISTDCLQKIQQLAKLNPKLKVNLLNNPIAINLDNFDIIAAIRESREHTEILPLTENKQNNFLEVSIQETLESSTIYKIFLENFYEDKKLELVDYIPVIKLEASDLYLLRKDSEEKNIKDAEKAKKEENEDNLRKELPLTKREETPLPSFSSYYYYDKIPVPERFVLNNALNSIDTFTIQTARVTENRKTSFRYSRSLNSIQLSSTNFRFAAHDSINTLPIPDELKIFLKGNLSSAQEGTSTADEGEIAIAEIIRRGNETIKLGSRSSTKRTNRFQAISKYELKINEFIEFFEISFEEEKFTLDQAPVFIINTIYSVEFNPTEKHYKITEAKTIAYFHETLPLTFKESLFRLANCKEYFESLDILKIDYIEAAFTEYTQKDKQLPSYEKSYNLNKAIALALQVSYSKRQLKMELVGDKFKSLVTTAIQDKAFYEKLTLDELKQALRFVANTKAFEETLLVHLRNPFLIVSSELLTQSFLTKFINVNVNMIDLEGFFEENPDLIEFFINSANESTHFASLSENFILKILFLAEKLEKNEENLPREFKSKNRNTAITLAIDKLALIAKEYKKLPPIYQFLSVEYKAQFDEKLKLHNPLFSCEDLSNTPNEIGIRDYSEIKKKAWQTFLTKLVQSESPSAVDSCAVSIIIGNSIKSGFLNPKIANVLVRNNKPQSKFAFTLDEQEFSIVFNHHQPQIECAAADLIFRIAGHGIAVLSTIMEITINSIKYIALVTENTINDSFNLEKFPNIASNIFGQTKTNENNIGWNLLISLLFSPKNSLPDYYKLTQTKDEKTDELQYVIISEFNSHYLSSTEHPASVIYFVLKDMILRSYTNIFPFEFRILHPRNLLNAWCNDVIKFNQLVQKMTSAYPIELTSKSIETIYRRFIALQNVCKNNIPIIQAIRNMYGKKEFNYFHDTLTTNIFASPLPMFNKYNEVLQTLPETLTNEIKITPSEAKIELNEFYSYIRLAENFKQYLSARAFEESKTLFSECLPKGKEFILSQIKWSEFTSETHNFLLSLFSQHEFAHVEIYASAKLFEKNKVARILSKSMDSLLKLVIDDSLLTDKNLNIENCKQLKYFILKRCHKLQFLSTSNSILKYLCIEECQQLSSISCKELSFLEINNCANLKDIKVAAVTTQLTSLIITSCPKIKSEHIISLADKHPDLKYIEIRDCPAITAFDLKKLERKITIKISNSLGSIANSNGKNILWDFFKNALPGTFQPSTQELHHYQRTL